MELCKVKSSPDILWTETSPSPEPSEVIEKVSSIASREIPRGRGTNLVRGLIHNAVPILVLAVLAGLPQVAATIPFSECMRSCMANGLAATGGAFQPFVLATCTLFCGACK